MKNEFNFEIINLEKREKFVFRCKYSWKVCLNANQEKSNNSYSLPFNRLNVKKLIKIDKNYFLENKDFLHSIPDNPNLTKELRPYQKADVNFLSKLNSIAIFNEMRTGKTPTSLMLTSKWRVSNLIIITPGILQQQWQSSVEEWLEKPAYIISQLSELERKTFYNKFCSEEDLAIIVSKDTFKNDSDYFSKIRKKRKYKIVDFCVIVDESHYLRNYDSQQSKSIYSLTDSKYKILLTGTPIVNSYSDIFGTLKFINPEDYNSYWSFVETFFNIQTSEFFKNGKRVFLKSIRNFKNRTSEVQLKNEIGSFSVSRKQKDVLPWLPMIIRQKEFLIMDEKQQELYNSFVSTKNYTIELISNLKSIILYPKHISPGLKLNGVKMDYIVEFCAENENKRIIIFSTRTSTFLNPLSKCLKDKKIDFSMITGEISNKQREISIKEFQSSAKKIILCNIQSAGFGLNLSQADTMIFADRSYSPAENEQAEARFLPTDSSQSLKVRSIIDLVCKRTIDEKIINLLKRKKDITNIINSNPSLLFND